MGKPSKLLIRLEGDKLLGIFFLESKIPLASEFDIYIEIIPYL